MSLPPSLPIIIPLDQLADGTDVDDVLTWDGTEWVSAPVSGALPDAFTGQALVYNGTSWEGSNSVRGVTITSATNATLTIADNKTLSCNNSLTFSGNDGTTMTFPNETDTVVCLSTTQTITNKTLTRPIITSETTPVGSTGMMYYDSTENLLRFYNGTFWQYINMYKAIIINLPNFDIINGGYFYEIPVYSIIGTNPSSGSVNSTFPTNKWSASSEINFLQVNPAHVRITHTTSAQGNWISFNFGTQDRGIYKLVWYCTVGAQGRGIIKIKEETTNVIFQEADLWSNLGVGVFYNTDFERVFTFNPNADTGNLTIRWYSDTNNSNSTGYAISLCNNIYLTRLG